MKCPNCGQPDDYGYCYSCDIYVESEDGFEVSSDAECENCGEPTDCGICECCDFIKRHPEVMRDDLNFVFWLSVEIDAMEQATEKYLIQKHADALKKEICRKNQQLKKKK